MFFLEFHIPGLNGDLTSPVATVMGPYLDMKTAEINIDIYTSQIQAPLHVIGYSPDIDKASQSAVKQANRNINEPAGRMQYPDPNSTITQDLTRLDYVNAMQHTNRTSRDPTGARTVKNDLGISNYDQDQMMGKSSLDHRISNYNRLKRAQYESNVSSRYSPTENLNTNLASGLASLNGVSPANMALYLRTGNIMWLKAYETYTPVAPPPAPPSNLQELNDHLETAAAEAIGFPHSILKASSLKTDKILATQEMNRIIRSDVEILSMVLKKVFSIAILPLMVENVNKVKKYIKSKSIGIKPKYKQYLLSLVSNCDVHISYPAVPTMDIELLFYLMKFRAVPPAISYQLLLSNAGFNLGDIGSVPPDFVKAIDFHFPIEQPEIESSSAPKQSNANHGSDTNSKKRKIDSV